MDDASIEISLLKLVCPEDGIPCEVIIRELPDGRSIKLRAGSVEQAQVLLDELSGAIAMYSTEVVLS